MELLNPLRRRICPARPLTARPILAALLALLFLLFLLLPTACSTKKNTAASRNYTAFITRYNIHFNGDEHFRETLKTMEESFEDDYSQRLMIHPVEQYGLPGATPGSQFTRSIEKAQKAIQLRSIKKRPARNPSKSRNPDYKEWLKREEYNPFLHNDWLLMAKSQYFDGDFIGAAATFHYIEKHFAWLPDAVAQSMVWQARCYVSAGWLAEAEVLLDRAKPLVQDDKRLQGLYDLTLAAWLIRNGRTTDAIDALQAAIPQAKGAQRTRLRFLLGQLMAETGRKAEAYDIFKSIAGSLTVAHCTRFNARIKQSEVYTGSDIGPEVKALRRMLRYGSNDDLRDQIHYAIGNLYLSRGDTLKAIDSYIMAERESKRNGMDKALAQLALGALYFERGDYTDAQPRYSEAVPQLKPGFPGLDTLKRRSDVLDELALYAGNVHLQDSLLTLADMAPEEQMAVINRIIDELNKREREEAEAARRAEAQADADAAAQNNRQNGGAQETAEFTLNNDKSWYFYNAQQRQRGKTEFQKRWGARKLEDNWRRRNKAAFSFAEATGTDTDNPDGEGSDIPDTLSPEEQAAADSASHESDPHYPEYYLAQIPGSPEERATAHEVIQEGRYNMGIILKDKLEDYPAARRQFDMLLSAYPDNVYRLDVYHNLYLMYMRLGDPAAAEHYRQLVLQEFADTPLGIALADPAYIDNLRQMNARQEQLYSLTYDAYLADDNSRVHALADSVRTLYPMSPLMPKFLFLDALAYVGQSRPDDFAATLEQLIGQYPDADVSPLASDYLKHHKSGRKLNSGTSNHRSMVWDIRLTNDSLALAAAADPAQFDLDDPGEQLLVLIYPADSVSANALLYDVARFNFATFVVRDYDLEQMNFGNLGLLVIRGFPSMADMVHYRRTFEGPDGVTLPDGVMPVVISAANFDILLTQGRSFEEYFNAIRQ